MLINKQFVIAIFSAIAFLITPQASKADPFSDAERATYQVFNFAGGVIGTAASYLGMHERKNGAALKRVTKVNPARTPWCAAFVNGVLRQNGRKGTGSNAASSFTRYGSATSNPAPGDVALIRRRGGSGYHVGFFKGYVNKGGRRMVAVLGGNQGNRVSVSYYPAGKVSFRRG